MTSLAKTASEGSNLRRADKTKDRAITTMGPATRYILGLNTASRPIGLMKV